MDGADGAAGAGAAITGGGVEPADALSQ